MISLTIYLSPYFLTYHLLFSQYDFGFDGPSITIPIQRLTPEYWRHFWGQLGQEQLAMTLPQGWEVTEARQQASLKVVGSNLSLARFFTPLIYLHKLLACINVWIQQGRDNKIVHNLLFS